MCEAKSDIPAEAFIDPATGKQLQYENKGEQFTLSGRLINIWPNEIKYELTFTTN